MKRAFFTLSCGVVVVAACAGPDAPTDASVSASRAAVDATPALSAFSVVLEGSPAVAAIPAGADARSAEAASATRKRLAEIELEQAQLEPALVARGATVLARLTRLANAIQVLTDDATAQRLASLPGVRRVERVPLIERALTSAVPVVRAPELWAGTPGLMGDGITIGIIDTGIDYTHADFGGPGTTADYDANDRTVIEPGSFPTAKVVGGWDFAGDAYNPTAGLAQPQPDPDPLDCATIVGTQISGGHGTHVAGIAAGEGVASDGSTFVGPYQASIDPSAFRVGPGVAPRASLYALKVFGCDGTTNLLDAALDRAADPNQDGSFDDRLDVVNASLGTSYALGSTLTGEMVTALTSVGTLLVVAAGNDGQSFFTIGSPAVYPEVLSVAASVDNQFLTLRVTAPASAVAALPIAESIFSAPLSTVGAFGADVVRADPLLGCSALTNAAEIAGKIALVDRGTCPFVDKVANAVAAGAVATIIVDDVDGELPFPMSGAPGSSPIPAVMLQKSDGAALDAALAQGPVTVGLDATDRYTGPAAELLAGFTSRGPSPIDFRLKPEIAAPGVDILSAGVGSGIEPANLQGTSMACPMVAGAAALARQAHPTLGPLEVKAVLMGSSVSLTDLSGAPYGTTVAGAGRVDVVRAAAARLTAAADPTRGDVGVSFGAVIAPEPVTVERTFVITNHGATDASLEASVEPTYALAGVTVTVDPAHVDVAAGQTATARVTLAFDPKAFGDPGVDPGTPAMQGNQTPTPRHYLNQASGRVRLVSATGDDVVVPYTGSVRGAVRRRGVAPSACDAPIPAGEPVPIALVGDGAHPAPVVSVFQLAALDDPSPKSAEDPVTAMTDLLAVGVATDLATAPSFEEASVYFGIAVNGPWATPALGPLSIVKIGINSDQTGSFDYELRAEARNPNGPFRDALVTRVYEVATGADVGRYPLDIVAPDVASTYPFQSTVVVLSARLADIGVDPANPVFAWSARTERPDLTLLSDQAKGTFDAAHPTIDVSHHGLGGTPLFVGSGPVLVDVSDEARESDALDVLLLHHTNVPGQQWEVVSLAKKSRGNLAVAVTGPEEVAGATTADVSIVVTNTGEESAENVTLSGVTSGGDLVSATAAGGTCAAGVGLDCALGDLEPGASVAVKAAVRASDGPAALTLRAAVASDLPCQASTADDRASISITVLPTTGLQATGGCACRAAPGGRDDAPQPGWSSFALVALLARRLRRPRRRPA